MKNSIMILLLVFSTANLFVEKFVSELKSLTGEKWYRAYTVNAKCRTPLTDITFQTYKANEKKIDLNTDNLHNQSAQVLISSMGRYVWSDENLS